jgi:hypothetical protein
MTNEEAPNPYCNDLEHRNALRQITGDMFRMSSLTTQVDPTLTATYIALVGFCSTRGVDYVRLWKALHWELCDLINHVTGDHVEFHVCDDDSHDHSHDMSIQTGSAFIAAAAEGDYPAAMIVLDVVVQESSALDIGDDEALAKFFGIAVASLGMTVQHHVAEEAAAEARQDVEATLMEMLGMMPNDES